MAEEKNMTSIGSVKIEVRPFDGKGNFPLWQRKMKNVFIQQDLYFVIEGKEKKPATMKDEDWCKADAKAMSSIELHLSDEVMFNVMEKTCAKGRDKLEKLYIGKSLYNKLFLKDEILNLRMEGGNVMEHLNVFNKCIVDLLRVDVKYDEEDKSLILLRSLPPSFQHFRTTLMFGKDTLKFETVIQDIISHVMMNQNTGESLRICLRFEKPRGFNIPVREFVSAEANLLHLGFTAQPALPLEVQR